MRRHGARLAIALALVAVLAAGLGVLVQRATAGKEQDVVRPGVLADAPVATLEPGKELCQSVVDIDRTVTNIGLAVFNGPRAGPPVRVRITDADTGDPLSTFVIPRGWSLPPGSYFGQSLPRPITGDRGLQVCARNDGEQSIELYGKNSISASALFAGEENVGGDWAIYFPLPEERRRTLLAAIPDMLDRAAVMRPGIVGPALYALLGVLLLVGAPLLLWRAVSRAAQED